MQGNSGNPGTAGFEPAVTVLFFTPYPASIAADWHQTAFRIPAYLIDLSRSQRIALHSGCSFFDLSLKFPRGLP